VGLLLRLNSTRNSRRTEISSHPGTGPVWSVAVVTQFICCRALKKLKHVSGASIPMVQGVTCLSYLDLVTMTNVPGRQLYTVFPDYLAGLQGPTFKGRIDDSDRVVTH